VLRSLGFGPMYVAAMLLGECAVVAAVGGIVGSAIAIWQFGSGTTLGAVLSYAGFLAMTPGAALTAFFIAVTVGIASASAPVIGALRAPPAEALRKII